MIHVLTIMNVMLAWPVLLHKAGLMLVLVRNFWLMEMPVNLIMNVILLVDVGTTLQGMLQIIF